MPNRNAFNTSLLENDMNKPEYSEFAQKEIRKILGLVKAQLFTDIYAACVPKKDRLKTQKAVRTLRKKEWEAALKKTKGNSDKAIDLLLKSYGFSK